jgi:hypothetical protein
MRFLRGIRIRLREFRPRRRVMRTVAGSYTVELYYGKAPITGTVTFTWTEVIPEEEDR